MRCAGIPPAAAAAAAAAAALSLLLLTAQADMSVNPLPFSVECKRESRIRRHLQPGTEFEGGGDATGGGGDDGGGGDEDDGGDEGGAMCEEVLSGNSEYAWREGAATGHTVLTDPDTGEEVYAELDETTGRLVPTKCAVRDCNPDKAGIDPHLTDTEDEIAFMCGEKCDRAKGEPLNSGIKRLKEERRKKRQRDREGGGGGGEGEDEEDAQRGRELQTYEMHNLVILVRFKDHRNRCLPSEADIGHLFNDDGGHVTHAPSGSVKDCFTVNSYGAFSMKSVITPWCDVPQIERYYTDGNYGMTGKLEEAIRHCLDRAKDYVDRRNDVRWGDFNKDDDDFMDAIAVLHSGYGAEWGGEDCSTKAGYVDRVWSHKWGFGQPWAGMADGKVIKVRNYHISPAMWGTCGCSIGRIGVICHETGHFLGLPDLYDGSGGYGVGTNCLMGNSWGYDGSQYYPPLMSPWSRNVLGWVDTEALVRSGTYELPASHSSPEVYVVVNPSKRNEYFMIENRQKFHVFDKNLPQAGLIMYHIDEDEGHTEEGYPGMAGWPGDHYRVAVVQADGQFNLEKGENMGERDDVFHAGGVNEISNRGTGRNGDIKSKEPSTDWYSGGRKMNSGFSVMNVGLPEPVMTFDFVMGGGGLGGRGAKPTPAPTRKVEVVDVGKEEPRSTGCVKKGGKCNTTSDCCTTPKMTCKQKSCKPRKNTKRGGGRRRKKTVMGAEEP